MNFNYKKFIIFLLSLTLFLILCFLVYKIFFGKTVVEDQEKKAEIIQEEVAEEKTGNKVFISFPNKINDKDFDGIDDDEEKELGTSDSTSDTDGDGLSDKVELERLGTDPNNIDSDGDGYSDGSEVINGYNPLGPGKL